MQTKVSIRFTIFCCCLIVFSLFGCNQKQSQKKAMIKVMREMHALMKETQTHQMQNSMMIGRHSRESGIKNLDETIANIEKMEKIKTSSCPKDFREAFGKFKKSLKPMKAMAMEMKELLEGLPDQQTPEEARKRMEKVMEILSKHNNAETQSNYLDSVRKVREVLEKYEITDDEIFSESESSSGRGRSKNSDKSETEKKPASPKIDPAPAKPKEEKPDPDTLKKMQALYDTLLDKYFNLLTAAYNDDLDEDAKKKVAMDLISAIETDSKFPEPFRNDLERIRESTNKFVESMDKITKEKQSPRANTIGLEILHEQSKSMDINFLGNRFDWLNRTAERYGCHTKPIPKAPEKRNSTASARSERTPAKVVDSKETDKVIAELEEKCKKIKEIYDTLNDCINDEFLPVKEKKAIALELKEALSIDQKFPESFRSFLSDTESRVDDLIGSFDKYMELERKKGDKNQMRSAMFANRSAMMKVSMKFSSLDFNKQRAINDLKR